jgi:hypothetical protein
VLALFGTPSGLLVIVAGALAYFEAIIGAILLIIGLATGFGIWIVGGLFVMVGSVLVIWKRWRGQPPN